MYWNTDSDQIESILDMLLNQVKSDGYSYKMSKLREIANQYYATVRRYEDGGVLTIEDRMVKWDFIDHSNILFGVAYDIVENFSRPRKSAE